MRAGLLEGDDDDDEDDDFSLRRSIASSVRGMYGRRAERDVANAQRYALEKPISDLLGAIDSLELGLKSAEDESAGREAVIEGMRLTLKQLVQALERHGLSRVERLPSLCRPRAGVGRRAHTWWSRSRFH